MADLNHLHLHVRDAERSRRFYERWFGFREHVRHGSILFLRDDQAFDLALAPDPEPSVFPAWFHFGFRLASGGAVESLHARFAKAKTPELGELCAEPDLVSFRVRDPDGYGIEVYWEPQPGTAS